ncbi:hypothetical protein JXC34_04465 [Candidatus Woesearchaeota archaeon]|nr:hypothetical protein [Candidatus Woesearchaeota archaeon]
MDKPVSESKGQYVVITFPSCSSVDDIKKNIDWMFDVIGKQEYSKVLVDMTSTKKKFRVEELWDIALSIWDKGIRHPKIALVSSRESAYDERFFQHMMQEFDINLIRFTLDKEVAVEWLNEKE